MQLVEGSKGTRLRFSHNHDRGFKDRVLVPEERRKRAQEREGSKKKKKKMKFFQSRQKLEKRERKKKRKCAKQLAEQPPAHRSSRKHVSISTAKHIQCVDSPRQS